jgi:hypothetical protein
LFGPDDGSSIGHGVSLGRRPHPWFQLGHANEQQHTCHEKNSQQSKTELQQRRTAWLIAVLAHGWTCSNSHAAGIPRKFAAPAQK